MKRILGLYLNRDQEEKVQPDRKNTTVSIENFHSKRIKLSNDRMTQVIDSNSDKIITEQRQVNTIDSRGIFSVIFQGHEGFSNSITHYYHFLYGVLVPLIEHYIAHTNAVRGYRIKTDVGPMKRILCELPLNILDIVGPENTRCRNDAISYPDHLALPAYDIFVDGVYGDPHIPTLTKSTVSKVQNFFDNTMPPYIRQLPSYDIILIERTNTESYYRTVETMKKHMSSGAVLRSIGNHTLLANALQAEYKDLFCNITLERSSIYYQYYIFSKAKIVIAQHGAALSNILFMKPTTDSAVIEILPSNCMIPTQFQSQARTHFINLAKHLGLHHIKISQENDHADVNIDSVLNAVRSAYHHTNYDNI